MPILVLKKLNRKTIKEFNYLSQKLGIFSALFFVFFKIKLWIKSFLKSLGFYSSSKILEKIYNSLAWIDLKPIEIQNLTLLSISSNFSKYSNFYLREKSSDLKVFNQIFVTEEYKPFISFINNNLKDKVGLIIDCGANIGFSAIYFNFFFPKARLILVEPFFENFELAKLNCNAARIENYEIIQAGISDTSESFEFNSNFRDSLQWSISLTKSHAGNIKGLSILNLLLEQNAEVDILKIDIEGGEVIIFQNNEYSSAWLKLVKCLVIEIHDEFGIRDSINKALLSNNFLFFNSNELTIAIRKDCIISKDA